MKIRLWDSSYKSTPLQLFQAPFYKNMGIWHFYFCVRRKITDACLFICFVFIRGNCVKPTVLECWERVISTEIKSSSALFKWPKWRRANSFLPGPLFLSDISSTFWDSQLIQHSWSNNYASVDVVTPYSSWEKRCKLHNLPIVYM